MVGSKIVKGKLPFPKLMFNENVVALFNSEEEGIVVHRYTEDSVPVGDLLKDNFTIEKFIDFDGIVELSNS